MLFERLITNESTVLDLIKPSISKNNRLLLTYLNQHCFNVYSTNQEYKNLIDNRFSIYADGVGVNIANKLLFKKKYYHFNATDLNEKLIQKLLVMKIKFFIIGGDFNIEVFENKFNFNPCFVGYNSGFFKEEDVDKIAKEIQSLSPEVILIGMGVPKQEIIAVKLSELVETSLILCVGNFFEFYFGTIKRIPNRFRNKGIEWIYRIFQEPKRLWKRYIIGILLFIFRVIKFKFSKSK